MTFFKHKYFFHSIRLMLGGIFFFMGIKGFVDFNGSQAGTDVGADFINSLMRTKFFWPFEKFLETLFGLLLLSNRFICIAIQGLAAIIINIVLYHAFLDPKHWYLALFVLLCEIYMYLAFWKSNYKNSFVKLNIPWRE
ncbi:MAG: hypothetical protein BM556_13625 [Bacteriovorax sp. MedPE-SWde]|nr:MAG: hypothetical protein BM556_13625 [Bacteriovorax sp. MedPE-SWde]